MAGVPADTRVEPRFCAGRRCDARTEELSAFLPVNVEVFPQITSGYVINVAGIVPESFPQIMFGYVINVAGMAVEVEVVLKVNVISVELHTLSVLYCDGAVNICRGAAERLGERMPCPLGVLLSDLAAAVSVAAGWPVVHAAPPERCLGGG